MASAYEGLSKHNWWTISNDQTRNNHLQITTDCRIPHLNPQHFDAVVTITALTARPNIVKIATDHVTLQIQLDWNYKQLY